MNELRRLGQGIEHGEDWLTITPAPVTPAVIECYADHRIAMSFAVLGCAVPGVTIKDPGKLQPPPPAHSARIFEGELWLPLPALVPDGSAVRFSPGCVAKTYPAFFEDLQKMRDHQAKGQAHNSCVLAVSADPAPGRALVAFDWILLLSPSLLGAGGRGDVRGARGAANPPIELAMFSQQFSEGARTCRIGTR